MICQRKDEGNEIWKGSKKLQNYKNVNESILGKSKIYPDTLQSCVMTLAWK